MSEADFVKKNIFGQGILVPIRAESQFFSPKTRAFPENHKQKQANGLTQIT